MTSHVSVSQNLQLARILFVIFPQAETQTPQSLVALSIFLFTDHPTGGIVEHLPHIYI